MANPSMSLGQETYYYGLSFFMGHFWFEACLADGFQIDLFLVFRNRQISPVASRMGHWWPIRRAGERPCAATSLKEIIRNDDK
jgi:hypothetical protein